MSKKQTPPVDDGVNPAPPDDLTPEQEWPTTADDSEQAAEIPAELLQCAVDSAVQVVCEVEPAAPSAKWLADRGLTLPENPARPLLQKAVDNAHYLGCQELPIDDDSPEAEWLRSRGLVLDAPSLDDIAGPGQTTKKKAGTKK